MRMTVRAGVIALAALSLLSIVPARAADMMDGAAAAQTTSIAGARRHSARAPAPAAARRDGTWAVASHAVPAAPPHAPTATHAGAGAPLGPRRSGAARARAPSGAR